MCDGSGFRIDRAHDPCHDLLGDSLIDGLDETGTAITHARFDVEAPHLIADYHPIRVVSRDGDRQGDDAGEYGQHDEAGGRAGIDLRLRMDRKPAPASQSHSAMSKTSRAGCVERSRSVREPPSAVGYRHVT